jgi:spore maturation protein B
LANNLFATEGPDSFAGRCASIIMGSSDTIIYTLAVYFSAAEIKKTRHALPASFIILIFCVAVSVVLTNIFFY